MKKKLILVTLIISFFISLNNSDGPAATNGQGYTGAPGENGNVCSTCHNSGGFGTTTSIFDITKDGVPVTNYLAGETYNITVTAIPQMGAPNGYGFQMTVLDANNNDVANFVNPASNTKISTAINVAGGRTYAEHNGTSEENFFSFDWVAPSITTGDVSFYYAVNVVDLNGFNSNDNGSDGFSLEVSETIHTVKVIGALQVNNEFTFPLLDGIPNQVLTTDGAGTVVWADNAAFTGGNTSSENFKVAGNENQDENLDKIEIENLKEEVVYLKSEIEALKELIDRLTKADK
jgi:hypothetical protein